MREAEFRAAIVNNSLADPHRRFGVYRNNVDGALCNALGVRFPVVEKILGRRDFMRLAKEYSAKSLPQSPVLIDYGDTLPAFIESEGYAPAYLGDIARLEDSWWKAYHAAEAMPLSAGWFQQLTLDDFAQLSFAFHPSVALVDSRWAIGSMWEAAKQHRSIKKLQLLDAEMVLVRRPGAEVHLEVVTGASRTLLPLLLKGKSLVEAVEATLAAHPDADLEAELRILITSQIITSIKPGNPACGQ